MKRLSLPMYDIYHLDTQALTAKLAQRLQADVEWPDDLLLSQTCGYPLMTQLPDVQLVGAFQLSATGCNGTRYRSWLGGARGGWGSRAGGFSRTPRGGMLVFRL